MVTGRLILCATPIGNLSDAPPRLGEVLREADVVYAEDTRRSRLLLDALGIDRPLRSYFVGNERRRSGELSGHLSAGKSVALITDAGTPSISDPGVGAVRVARRTGADVRVVPGPSAVTAALALSGLDSRRFAFEGFLPRKGAGRATRLKALAGEERTMVFFCATQRVVADLEDLAAHLGRDRAVTVCREMTKLHEETLVGSLEEVAGRIEEEGARGEYTLVVAGAAPQEPSLGDALDEVLVRMEDGESLTGAVRIVAGLRGVPRRALYQAALDADRPPLADDPGDRREDR